MVIRNYGEALFSLDPAFISKGLDSLKKEFSLFTGDVIDTLQILQLRDFVTDPFNRELAGKCREEFPDLEFLSRELSVVFNLAEMEFPGFQKPEVYTYVSGLLYEHPVHYDDSVLVIALDMFLGWGFEPYRAAGIPVYMTRRMERQNIAPECCREIARFYMPEDLPAKTLLDQMILHGKLLYAMDVLLPSAPDSLKIGYTADQFKWIRQNERSVWMLLMDQEALYRSDPQLKTRFIQDGPFTSGLPEGAPAMLGRWIGWQIARSYMKKNPETTLVELFAITDAKKILSASGYKPGK